MPGQPWAGFSQPFPSGAAPVLWAGEGCQAGGAVCRCVHPPGLHHSRLRPGPQEVPLCPGGARASACPVLPGGRAPPRTALRPWAPLLYRGWNWALQPCTFSTSSAWASPGPWGVLGLDLSTSPDSNPGSCRLGPVPCPVWACFLLCKVMGRWHLPRSAAERAEAKARDPAGLGGRQAESTITTSL